MINIVKRTIFIWKLIGSYNNKGFERIIKTIKLIFGKKVYILPAKEIDKFHTRTKLPGLWNKK